jgi:hypothetical protein
LNIDVFQEMLGLEISEIWTETELTNMVKQIQRRQRMDMGYTIG